jgi:CRISPR-associated protein Cas2
VAGVEESLADDHGWLEQFSTPIRNWGQAPIVVIGVCPRFLGGSAMRKIYLVTYDIRDDKRLRKVFKTMRNWGDHLQYSVFECQLNPVDLLKLKAALKEIINAAHDQVLFVDLGPAAGRGDRVIEALGQPYVSIASPCLIV